MKLHVAIHTADNDTEKIEAGGIVGPAIGSNTELAKFVLCMMEAVCVSLFID